MSYLQTDNPDYDEQGRQHPPYPCRIAEKHNADQQCTYRPYSSPDAIGRTDALALGTVADYGAQNFNISQNLILDKTLI